jgi:NAD(P)-dependent dehydrogenase (short-subunit alcohol dehydrogenase family)
MDLQLNGKRALVTGSSDGIGEAIAIALAREGAAVVVHGRSEGKAAKVAQAITAAGGRAVVALGDLARDDEAARVAEQALGAFGGGIDVLVNNVGVFPQKPWLDTTAGEWNDLYNQNVSSMVRMITRLVPGMVERRWGRAIQIASGAASRPAVGMSNYAATKAANVSLTVGLAMELAGTGVTANTVSPGPILTSGLREMILGMASKRGWGDDWDALERKFVAEFSPTMTGRIGRPEDVAAMVAFVASPLAGNITGANLRVDGGVVGTTN